MKTVEINGIKYEVIENVDNCLNVSELEEKIAADPGHIIATTACLGGEFSKNILRMEEARRIGDVTTAEQSKQNIINFV